jgi:hypothetical protein
MRNIMFIIQQMDEVYAGEQNSVYVVICKLKKDR